MIGNLVRVAGAIALANACVTFAPERAMAGAPVCVGEALVEPAQPYVGQQILYRARILRREDVDSVQWEQPPAFPNLRAEWLPGRAEDTRVTRDGATYLVREDHRALFAAWPGSLQLPDFTLRCDDATATVAGPALRVRAAPTRERPADFTGVMGPLVVQATADAGEISVGQSVRVSVLVRGDSNLWDLETPLTELAAEGRLDVFEQRPELDLEAGERLYVRRYFRFDLVPHEAGRLEIPAVRIPYFDTLTGRFAAATTDPIEIRVTARRTESTARAQPGRVEPAASSQVEGPPTVAVVGLAALVFTALSWRAFTRSRRSRAAHAEIEEALANAARCAERRDVTGQAASLNGALEAATALASPRRRAPLEEEIGSQHQRLDAIRFAPQPRDPDGAAIESLIRRLR